MIIAISAKGKNKSDLLDSRFGRCEYFQLLDTENGTIKCINNEGLETSGGAGIAAANQIIKENASVVITGFLGPNAFNIIDASDIEAYKCDTISVEEAIEKYNKNELEKLNNPGEAHRGMKN